MGARIGRGRVLSCAKINSVGKIRARVKILRVIDLQQNDLGDFAGINIGFIAGWRDIHAYKAVVHLPALQSTTYINLGVTAQFV
jgi:hypothetical protein